MIRRVLVATAILAFVAIAGLLLRNRFERIARNVNPSPANAAPNQLAPAQTASSFNQIRSASMTHAQITEEVTRRDHADSKWEWKIPIQFYGIAVDENEHPVAGADVYFQWTNLSAKGTSDTST